MKLTGEANDYIGKGMAGGELVIVPPPGVHGRAAKVLEYRLSTVPMSAPLPARTVPGFAHEIACCCVLVPYGSSSPA